MCPIAGDPAIFIPVPMKSLRFLWCFGFMDFPLENIETNEQAKCIYTSGCEASDLMNSYRKA